jgi:hypothetical protein
MAVFPAIVNVACREIDTDEKLKKNIDTLPALIRRENIDVFTKPITGMVLDGAYATMQKLTEEFLLSIQEEGFKIPIPMMKVAVKMVIQSCQQQTDVDFELLRPIDFVSGCFIPALFVTGKDDKYVASHHSEELAAKYGGAAIKMQVDGDHYGRRSKAIYTETVRFLYNSLSRDTL